MSGIIVGETYEPKDKDSRYPHSVKVSAVFGQVAYFDYIDDPNSGSGGLGIDLFLKTYRLIESSHLKNIIDKL